MSFKTTALIHRMGITGYDYLGIRFFLFGQAGYKVHFRVR